MKERIKIVENSITIDVEKLKRFIIDEWQSGKLHAWHRDHDTNEKDIHDNVLWEVVEEVEFLLEETEKKAQKKLNKPNAQLDWDDKYPKSDVRSIGFAVANFLEDSGGKSLEELSIDDIPAILEFLDTPPDKSLEAWEKWEKYWNNLDYAERRKKLLANTEK